MLIDQALGTLRAREHLSAELMAHVMDECFNGLASDPQIAELLTLLHTKGESVEELVGAARALRQRMATVSADVDSQSAALIDTCGTGGGGLGLMNISTAAAIVAAAAGASVAKHGNRAFTSRSGSADVLIELGVNIEAPLEVVQACLHELNICFCFAPLFHGSVKRVTQVRRQLPFPTIFNLVGPLCNPARAPFQLLGAGRGETRHLLAQALQQLGTRRSMVVHGADGLGEVTLADHTHGLLVTPNSIEQIDWSPEDFGLTRQLLNELKVSSPQQSAELIRGVLRGQSGVHRDITVANAAAALWIVGRAKTPKEGVEHAAAAIDQGQAERTLQGLIELTNQASR